MITKKEKIILTDYFFTFCGFFVYITIATKEKKKKSRRMLKNVEEINKSKNLKKIPVQKNFSPSRRRKKQLNFSI